MVGESNSERLKKKRNRSKNQIKPNQIHNDLLNESKDIEQEENLPEKKHISQTSFKSPSESDSESVKEPKKKKKKKKPETSSAQSSNKSKSIRQAKREKFAQRQAETFAAAKEQTKSECLNYLSLWKYNRQNWKFMKAKQVWLYKNKFSESLIPKNSWSLLLEYFESAKGNIRNMLLDDANKIIKQMDDWTESQKSEETTEESAIIKPNEAIYKRARELLQFLQE